MLPFQNKCITGGAVGAACYIVALIGRVPTHFLSSDSVQNILKEMSMSSWADKHYTDK